MKKKFDFILEILATFPQGASIEDVSRNLKNFISKRTLQRYVSMIEK